MPIGGGGENTTDDFDNTIVVIADKDDPTKKAKVDTNGSVFVNLKDGAGAETGTTANPLNVSGPTANGAALSGRPVRIGYSDGTNVRDALSDANGRAVIVGAGVAGTPAGGVLSIQGVAGGTAVPISAAALPLPAGAATAANQGTIITAIQLLDDVPTAQNGAFVKGNPIMGHLDDTGTVAATEDAIATVRITPQRAIHTNLRNQAGAEVGTTTSPIGARLTDGSDTLAITATGEAKVVDGLRQGGVFKELSIPTAGTAVEVRVGASRLTNRKFITIHTLTNNLWWGYDNTVTTATGTPLANGQFITFNCDPDSTFQIWLVGSSNSRIARITEST